jgi:hypothetical protein
MNTYEKTVYEQLIRLIAFKNENEEELKTVLLLWSMLEDAVAYYTRLVVLIKEDDKTSKVLTQEKENAFNDLLGDAVNIEGMLMSYGNYKEFIPFQKIEGCKKSDLNRARDEDVITNVQNMVTVINSAPAERLEAGVSDERLAALEGKIIVAQDNLYGPKEFRLQQHDVGVRIGKELNGFKNLLNNSIKPNVQSNFADSKPELYEAFLNAIHIDALHKKTKVLTGSFKNEQGEPVSDVWIKLDDEKAVKRGGKKGLFYFYNVPPGQHTLVFSKKSYNEEKRVFMLEADHTMNFDIVFTLKEVVVESDSNA